MEKDRGENSLKQQLTGALAFTEVPLQEKKKIDVISSHNSGKSLNPAEPPLFGFSFGGIPSRPRSKPSSIPQRRVNREWISPVTPSKNESQFANSESKVPKTRVNREWISPVPPSKNESQFANSESEVPETDSPVQRKQKRKKYKPKVVDDGNKLTKSRPANFTSNPSERNSFPISPDLKYTNAQDQTATVPKPQGPSGPITPGPKPTTPEAPVTPEPISQHKRAHNTPDLKYENPKRIRLSGAADLNPEKLEFKTVTSDPNPGLVQFFVGRKRGLHINSDETIADTELIIEKSSMVMQLSNDNVFKPVKSVRRRLDFTHEDYIEQVNPNMDKSSTPINLNCDDLIEIAQPLREENMAGITRSPEKSTDIITSSDSDNANKPLQLVSNGLNFDLGDKTELVILGKVGSGMDPSLNQAGIEKFKCLAEDIFDQIGPKDNLFQFTTQRFRGVKRERAPKSKLDEMLDEIILKMKHMKLYENALIPYQEKKEKYRGIVALDKDSLVEWNLLMGEGGSKSAPGANPEREEKWRKERDTFRNLAECFIAKMKLIQGDRRFSEWKGSVVDSVVGAFLTQNVSDQLSSSAFISLSARYPRRRDGNATWPEKKFSDFEWTKSRLVDNPTSPADTVDPHIESIPQKVPEDNAPQEFTKERSGSHTAKKANNLSGKKGYRIGMEHVEWDNLRKEASSRHGYTREGRSAKREDAADWDAVRQADTGEVAKAIHGRGQDNVLAERIQDFLNRVAEDHGSVDLEWLREIPGDQAKEYLLSIYGLGLKSVECVRLLALQQVAFPVDTNVGRICVRLGWVPLQPLPESVQIHLLEMYPVLDSIQKYLWPRLCKLDQKTLYELHYQMITFGKVFCTKSKPNCNACPLRSECKHFASAFASARLTLPGPQEKQENKVVLWNGAPSAFQNASKSFYNPTDLPASQFTCLPRSSNSEPIIEEPMTPEEEHIVEELPDIEDLCFDDSDEIPTINLNMESFVKNIEELVRTNDSELQIEDISKALVLLPPIATSIPPPKLKHSRHLRTVHDAYELPDDHPILRWLEFEERDPDDPSPYLLILYSPEKEIAESKKCLCTSCNETKSCDFLSKEEEIEYVKCSIMIPCRTATRGGFPLNGTYFQVNEVFADHVTARNPVMVPREEIWRLRRHPVYFGSTISAILKGLSTEEVQYCFWRGFVCVREFDRVNRYPKPLSSWLHILPTVKKKLQQTKS